MAKKRTAPKYRVLVGLNYPPDRRAEPGDIVDDIPPVSIPWLLRDRAIEAADAPDPEPKEVTS
jgi:hypothetical protein